MASGRRITKTTVDRLQVGLTVWDDHVRGFGARKQRRDPFYILKYRAGGKQRFYTIGRHGSPWTVDTARREAKRLLGELAKGTDPAVLRDKMKGAPTLREFAKLYLSDISDVHKKPSTASQDRRILNKHILPTLGDRKVAEIDRADVTRLQTRLKGTPILANRTLALLSHMLNHACDKGERLEGSNPCRKVKRYPEQKRERFLTIEELARLGGAIAEGETVGIQWEPNPRKKTKHAPKPEKRNRAYVSQHAAAALRLLLFTGARLREILHLQWEHVDFERGVLLIPDSKTGKKTIVLNAPARAVLVALPRVGRYVIAGEMAGTDKERPKADLNRPWRTVTIRAGLTGVRLHDLRHTFASYGAGASLGLPILGKLLGHVNPATTTRYAHLETDPLRKASDTIGNRIADALGSAELASDNVVAIAEAQVVNG